MLVVRLAFFPLKVGTTATKVAAKTGYRTGRLLGFRRLFLLGIGIFIGLLIAPGPGRELRAKLQALLAGPPPSADVTLGGTLTGVPGAKEADNLLTVTGTNGHN